MDFEHIYKLASDIRKKAYAPYSKFLVGSCLVSDVGIHVGANVENASYGCGVCAEASAISSMISSGGRRIKMICVSGDADAPVTPCGNCRQKIREFSTPETEVHIVDGNGHLTLKTTLQELLLIVLVLNI